MKRMLCLTLIAFLALGAFSLAAADPAPALDTVAAHAPAVVQAAPAVMPALPALPAQHDAGSIILWVIASLIPWLGWAASELMALIPGLKSNGILHGILGGLGTISGDAEKGTVTLSVKELADVLRGNSENRAAGA